MLKTSDSHGKSSQPYIVTTAFLAMMAIVGFALYGLPFFYDQWIDEFHWSRVTVTSGNAFSKLLVAPLFGFIAGWIIDKYGPRRVMLAGILMAGGALIGLGLMSSLWMFYFFISSMPWVIFSAVRFRARFLFQDGSGRTGARQWGSHT